MGIVNRLKNRFPTSHAENCIVVTSNCQTHGIASSLNLMLPSFESIPVWSLSGLDFVVEQINSKVKRDFIWVTTLGSEQQKIILKDSKVYPSKIIQIPEIFFDAFHPDMTYVQLVNGDLLESALGHYHSKISLWAYLNNVDLSDTLNLFSSRSYDSLGYFQKHANAIQGLRNSILAAGLDVTLFDEIINHGDSFMHTFNHPKLKVLSALAQSVCLQLERTPAITHSEIPLVVRDVLFESGPIYPIYPEIADFFGIHGTYSSRRQDGRVLSLKEFTEESFEIYSKVSTEQFNQESLFTEFFRQQMKGLVQK